MIMRVNKEPNKVSKMKSSWSDYYWCFYENN